MIPARESNLSFALPEAALPPIQSNQKILQRAFGPNRRCVHRLRAVRATAAVGVE
jgi:hypothetical protein